MALAGELADSTKAVMMAVEAQSVVGLHHRDAKPRPNQACYLPCPDQRVDTQCNFRVLRVKSYPYVCQKESDIEELRCLVGMVKVVWTPLHGGGSIAVAVSPLRFAVAAARSIV